MLHFLVLLLICCGQSQESRTANSGGNGPNSRSNPDDQKPSNPDALNNEPIEDRSNVINGSVNLDLAFKMQDDIKLNFVDYSNIDEPTQNHFF